MRRKLYPLPNGETGFVQREFSLSGRGGWLWGYCDPSEGTSDTIGIADTMGAAAIELLKFAAGRGGHPMKLVSLHWEPADGQGIMDGGDHDPATVDRETEERAFLAELLGQCATEEERETIRLGAFVWSDECAFCGAAGAKLAATDDPRTVGDDPLCDRCRDALELDPD